MNFTLEDVETLVRLSIENEIQERVLRSALLCKEHHGKLLDDLRKGLRQGASIARKMKGMSLLRPEEEMLS